MTERNLSQVKLVIWQLIAVSLGVVTIMLVLSVLVSFRIDMSVPAPQAWGTHRVMQSEGDAAQTLLMIPIFTLLLSALLMGLPFIGAQRRVLEESLRAYTANIVGLWVFMLGVHIIVLLYLIGWRGNVAGTMTAIIGVWMLVQGNYMGKMDRHFALGFRSPWMHASDRSWDRTQRLGGRTLLLLGLAYIVMGALNLRPLWLYPVLLIGGLMLDAIAITVYSYYVWKADPDRRPAAWAYPPQQPE